MILGKVSRCSQFQHVELELQPGKATKMFLFKTSLPPVSHTDLGHAEVEFPGVSEFQ